VTGGRRARTALAALGAGALLAACQSGRPASPPPPTPPAFSAPAPGRVTVLSVAYPGAAGDPAGSRLDWAAGPVAAGPGGEVLIADTDSDDGRVVVVARDGARSRFGGERGPKVGPAGIAVTADGTLFTSQPDRVLGYDRSGAPAVTIGGGAAAGGGPPPYPGRPGARFDPGEVTLRQPGSLTVLGAGGVAFVDHPGGAGTGTARVWAWQAGELRLLAWVDRGVSPSPGLAGSGGAPFVVDAITAMPDGKLLAASADSPERLLRIDPTSGAVTSRTAPRALPRADAGGDLDPGGDRLALSGIASDGRGGWLLAGGFQLFHVDAAGTATLLLRGGRSNPCGAIPAGGLAARDVRTLLGSGGSMAVDPDRRVAYVDDGGCNRVLAVGLPG
jgi:DNA-binding beta-propeller fold protein YncE